jgi:D-3-phosphoglycerate dehydrogenase
MKILFVDLFPEPFLDALRDKGHSVTYQPELGAEDLAAKLPGYDALVVRSTRVGAAALDATDDLRLVVRAGAGTNTIDKERAAERNVHVCNVPGMNAIAVAELAMGLLIGIDRRIPDNVAELRAGRWDKKRFSQARGLYGRTLGIVGLGAVGLAMAERAAAFGLEVAVIEKPNRSAEVLERLQQIGVVYYDSLAGMIEDCDIVSIHVPGGPDTAGLFGAEMLARVKPGAIIINTSRGDVIDAGALIRAMDEKDVHAGLDVYPDEPTSGTATFDSPLAHHPNVYGTHHIGASTAQAQEAVAAGVVEIIDAYGEGQVLNCVNMAVSK